MTRFFKMTRHGIVEDPVGAQIAFDYCERRLLGDVRAVVRDEVCGVTSLRVTHFNGEPWPVEPLAILVEVSDEQATVTRD